LTFYYGAQTTSDKSASIPQLTCTGGNGCKYSDKVKIVQCSCTGLNDFNDPQWKCQSELPNDLRLGQVVVSCEGCNEMQNGKYLIGSCGLYYNLNHDKNINHKDYDKINKDIENGFLISIGIVFVFLLLSCMFIAFYECFAYIYRNTYYTPLSLDSFREVEAIPVPIESSQTLYNNSYVSSTASTPRYVKEFTPSAPPAQLNTQSNYYYNSNKNDIETGKNTICVNSTMNSRSTDFTTGLVLGNILSSDKHNKHYGKHHGKHHKQQYKQTSLSTTFGGTITR